MRSWVPKEGSFMTIITQGLHSRTFLGLLYRILYMNPKKELL